MAMTASPIERRESAGSPRNTDLSGKCTAPGSRHRRQTRWNTIERLVGQNRKTNGFFRVRIESGRSERFDTQTGHPLPEASHDGLIVYTTS